MSKPAQRDDPDDLLGKALDVDPRETRLNLRFTQGELATLDQRAKHAGLTRTNYARMKIFADDPAIPAGQQSAGLDDRRYRRLEAMLLRLAKLVLLCEERDMEVMRAVYEVAAVQAPDQLRRMDARNQAVAAVKNWRREVGLLDEGGEPTTSEEAMASALRRIERRLLELGERPAQRHQEGTGPARRSRRWNRWFGR